MKAILLALAAYTVTALSWVRMESDVTPGEYIPQGWTQLVKDPNPDTILKVTFALKRDNTARQTLHNKLMDISNPKSVNYGAWLSIPEITNIMGVAQSNIDIVTNYLTSFGVESEVFVTRDMVIAYVPIRTLETMLNTKFRAYEKEGAVVNRVDRPYHLPTEVAQVVSIVDPLIRFPARKAIRAIERIQSGAVGNWSDYCGLKCHGKITPQVIQQQYKIDLPPNPPNAQSGVAVAEFQTQFFNYDDLNLFADSCSLKRYNVTVNGLSKDGTGIECLLDLEYLASLTQPIPIADYFDVQYSLLDWAQTVNNDPDAPYVHSVSYGNDERQQTSVDYMLSCNDQFMQVTSRGITILFASGDQGVWGRTGVGATFNPDFPAASPYILAVGGSDLSTTNIGPETCCTDSGGGFSDTFARPDWQNDAVTNYINTATLPNQALWNATGRGYPDISAIFGLYIPYCIAAGGSFEGVAGTSASSPVAASVIGLLNDIRLSKNKPTLGFANPWIYQTFADHPEAFNDITTGKNSANTQIGFDAIAGWDPCTGVGTLNYAVLKTLV